jgi:hypothetical protein
MNIEERIKELKMKLADGTITEKESETLAILDSICKARKLQASKGGCL